MKIVRPSATLIPNPLQGVFALRSIESAARISHGSEDAQTEDSWKRFIQAVVMDKGDWSVVEHVTASVDFKVDRGITHELVRHRLFSYTQSSTRFINYAKKQAPEFIYPLPDVECKECLSNFEIGRRGEFAGKSVWTHRPNRKDMASDIVCSYHYMWLDAIDSCEIQYKRLLLDGWRPQEARSVFPNALASNIRMTGNLRSWRWFFQMRTSKESHPQMRQVTIPLLAEFQENFPLLFDDITPNESQAVSTARRH